MRRSETRGKPSPDTTVATQRATDDLVCVLVRACASSRACASLVFANPPAHTREIGNKIRTVAGRRDLSSLADSWIFFSLVFFIFENCVLLMYENVVVVADFVGFCFFFVFWVGFIARREWEEEEEAGVVCIFLHFR